MDRQGQETKGVVVNMEIIKIVKEIRQIRITMGIRITR